MLQKNESKTVQFWYKLAELIGAQWIARAVVIVAIFFLAALIYSFVAPAAGEAWVYNITLFSGILTACLMALVCIMIVSVGVNMATAIIGAGIKQAREMNAPQHEQQKALPANTDLIIAEKPGEFDFVARLNGELESVGSDKYVAVIKFRASSVLLMMGGKEATRPRADIVPGYTLNAATETEDEYNEFLNLAYYQLNDYFADNRKKVSGNVKESFLGVAARFACFAFLVIAPFAVFAQSKTERVQNGVPQIAGQVFPAKTFVRFDFAKGGIERFADGSATLVQLVAQSRPGADADNMGEFKGAVVGTTYYEAKKAEQTQPLFTSNMVPHNMAIQVPDSLKVVQGIEGAKQSFYFYKSKLWSIIQPVIDFIFWLLLSLLPLIAAVVFWLNVGARSAGANKNLGPKVKEKEIRMAALAWEINFYLAGGVLLLFSISTFFWEIHPFWAVVLTGIGGVIAYWEINLLTPNPENKAKQNDRNDYGSKGPALPRG